MWNCRIRSTFRADLATGQTPEELPTLCFKNLPIEFDAQGNATLKPGAANPYSYTETPLPTPIEDDPERMRELFARNGAVRRVDFDPVTRVAGALAFHTVVDLESRAGHGDRVDGDAVSRLRDHPQGSRPARCDLHLQPRLRRVRRRPRQHRGARLRDGVRDPPPADGDHRPQPHAGRRIPLRPPDPPLAARRPGLLRAGHPRDEPGDLGARAEHPRAGPRDPRLRVHARAHDRPHAADGQALPRGPVLHAPRA